MMLDAAHCSRAPSGQWIADEEFPRDIPYTSMLEQVQAADKEKTCNDESNVRIGPS
jgi:hypothetical protein